MIDSLTGRLVHGDAAALLRALPAGSVDMVYIDPPFCTGKTHHGDTRPQEDSFEDRFDGGVPAYLEWIRPMLEGYLRVLKPSGNLFVHVDYRVSHYLKVELDKIFGARRFVNEIIWCYRNCGRPSKGFARKHDTILFYAAGNDSYWGDYKVPIGPGSYLSKFKPEEGTGRLKWTSRGPNGREYVYYADEDMIPNDWWTDIPALGVASRERTGWPTQKPLALLERVIEAGCPKGGLVLDTFCGGGTTASAAQGLGRRWIASDILSRPLDLTRERLEREHMERPDIVALGEFHWQGLADESPPPPKYKFPKESPWDTPLSGLPEALGARAMESVACPSEEDTVRETASIIREWTAKPGGGVHAMAARRTLEELERWAADPEAWQARD